MTLADELRKLEDLRKTGTLTDDEFAQAKAALLRNPPTDQPVHRFGQTGMDNLGDAAKTWVNFKIVMSIVGFIIAAIFFFLFWLPQWNKMGGRF